MPNPFQNLRPSSDSGVKSLEWYRSQVKKLAGLKPEKMITGTGTTTRIVPGKMYMFLYEAKFKDTLPYYDQFPLVLPFRGVPGGFYGINLHYLPYMARYKLLGTLQEQTEGRKVTEDYQMRVSWDLLNKLSGIAPISFSVKHYLNDQVKSKFLEIKYPDWITASQLPVERFVGASKQKVWQDSRKNY